MYKFMHRTSIDGWKLRVVCAIE